MESEKRNTLREIPDKFNLTKYIADTEVLRHIQDIVNAAYREGYANGESNKNFTNIEKSSLR